MRRGKAIALAAAAAAVVTFTGAAPASSAVATPACVSAACHAELGRLKQPHAPVREGRCDACHAQRAPGHPEGAGPEFRLAQERRDVLCYACHDALAAQLRAATSKHAPVAQGECGACHAPHGSDSFGLFRSVTWRSEWEYPYGPPRIDLTKLCWECHDRRMLQGDEPVGEVTRFRDGERNLHRLHVRDQPGGRGCKSCHETHAGRQPSLMRDSVPFGTGGWRLPVRFTPTTTGGACVVGCHRPQEYDRAKAKGARPGR